MKKSCSNLNCLQNNPQVTTEFNRKGEGLQDRCRGCNKIQSRQYYADNREKHLLVIRKRKERILIETQNKYLKYLSSHPCKDCNEKDVLVLEADHLQDKKYNISNMIRTGYSWLKILEELDKCEIVCANCHRRRTYKRLGSYRNSQMV